MSAGRPRVGQVHDNRLAARARYKHAIRAAHIMYEEKVHNRLFNCLLKLDSQKFWKNWKDIMTSVKALLLALKIILRLVMIVCI